MADKKNLKLPGTGKSYTQISGVQNPLYRDDWVDETLRKISKGPDGPGSVLDVGAGTGPYRPLALELGFHYRGQDFAGYSPSEGDVGLQHSEWKYTDLEFTCDVLDIPREAESSLVLCSEVLEHVPNPAEAFYKMWSLVAPGGSIAVTVPFLSLMHQAPHWYSSGLSPFWFAHHASHVGCTDFEIIVHGDYFDLMSQELARLLYGGGKFQRIVFWPVMLLFRVALALGRKLAPSGVREMGAFGVTFLGKKPVRVE